MKQCANEYIEHVASNTDTLPHEILALGGKFSLTKSTKIDMLDLWCWNEGGIPKYTPDDVKYMRVHGFYGHDVDPSGKITSSCFIN